MAINILQELNLGSAKPSFSRDEVASLDAIKNLQENKYPDNYEIFCKEDGCKYRLNKTAHSTMQGFLPHPTGKWRRSDSVISSSMPRPITLNDVILYLGPTTYSQQYSDKILFQTGKYYRTEYGVTNKQMYAYVQNIEPGVPDENEPPAVIWYSDSETLSVNSILYKPVNGSIKNNMEHPIITAEPASQTEISGEEYIYGDGSEETKPGLVRNSKYDSTFDSYPVLEWKLFDTEAELENFKENIIPETVKDEVATALEDVNVEELAGLGDKVSSLSDSIDSLTESIPEDGMTYLNSTLYSGKQWSYLNQPTSYNYDWTSYNKLLKVNNDLYDHTDNNRSINPLFKNYFDSASSASYVTPKNIITYDSDSPTWSSKSYVGAMVCIDSTNVPISSILTKISGYIVERKTSEKFYLGIDKYRGIELELCDIYIGWSTTLAANNITSDRYVWERVDATKPANVANILSNLTPKQAYYNYPVIFMVFRAISYDSNHDINPLFESDVLSIPTEDVINHYLTISYRKLEDKIEGIANSVDKLEEDLESLDPESISEAVSKVERLDSLTDDIISDIVDKELLETTITGGNPFDWSDFIVDGELSPNSFMDVKLKTKQEQITSDETCFFVYSLDDFIENDVETEGGSFHRGTFSGPSYYEFSCNMEYIDALLTNREWYHDGIMDASDEEYAEEAFTWMSRFFRESSLGTMCMYMESSIVFPDFYASDSRWPLYSYIEYIGNYELNATLGSYTSENNVGFDIDELWLGINVYYDYEKMIEIFNPYEGYTHPEALHVFMGIDNNMRTTYIRLAVRDINDPTKNTIKTKLKDIVGFSHIIENAVNNLVEESSETIDEETARSITAIRFTLLTPINTHIAADAKTLNVYELRDAHLSSVLAQHISISKETKNFIDSTREKLDSLIEKNTELETKVDTKFEEIEPKLDGLTGPSSTEHLVSPASSSTVPSLDNLALAIGYNITIQNIDGYPMLMIRGSLRAPFEDDISEYIFTTTGIDQEMVDTCILIGQLTVDNGASVSYSINTNENMLKSKIVIDASKMPEGITLKKVLVGLIPTRPIDAVQNFVMFYEAKQNLSEGVAIVNVEKSTLNSFIKAYIEEGYKDIFDSYGLGLACCIDIGDKAEDASFLNDLDFSMFNEAIHFEVPGENLLSNLPDLTAEKERTSKVSNEALNLLNVIGESYNIADMSRLLAYKENYASLIRQMPITPVTSSSIINDSGNIQSLETAFNGLVYLGDNFDGFNIETKTLKPEIKNFMDSSLESYAPLKDIFTPYLSETEAKSIGLFSYFNVVDDGLSSRDTFRTAVSFNELKQVLKSANVYIEQSNYMLDESSTEEKLRNGLIIPETANFSSMSSFCLHPYATYITVMNSDDYNKYKPIYTYNSKNICQDLTKYKWVLCNDPLKSLYEIVSENFTEEDFDKTIGTRYLIGVISVLPIYSASGTFSDDEDSSLYQDLIDMDFTSQIPKLCYAGFNKIADFDVAANNAKSSKESIGNLGYKILNSTPIGFTTQTTPAEGATGETLTYDSLIYPRIVMPPIYDSSTDTYTVRFHGTTDEEKNITVQDIYDNGELFMFFSFFGENLLHIHFGGDYQRGEIAIDVIDQFNRTGGLVWYEPIYMKSNNIDFSQHTEYDASEMFINIDSSQVRELYAVVIPNDTASNSIQQYFTSQYNGNKVLEQMSDIPGFIKVPLDYHEEDLSGTIRTVSLESIIDLCGRPIYNGSFREKGGYILFVAKLNETKARALSYLNDYTDQHSSISSFHPFNYFRDNFGYYSAYNFGWTHFFPSSQNAIDDPPCYITISVEHSIKQAKNIALKSAQDAVADKTKVPTFYTSYSNLKSGIQNGEMGYLVKVDPNNSSNYLADIYIKTLDGTIIKMSEDVECEPSQSIINALNG